MSRSPGCVPDSSRLRSLALVLVALLAWPAPAVGQAISLPTIHAAPRAGSIEIDGRLHEREWTTVDPFDAFVQGEPMEGGPAEAPTSVRVLYDRDAIYIGARMDDPAAGSIARQLTRRGEVGDAVDHFEVSFDSNNDRRTAYTFRVTAAGVQSDRYRYDDTSEDGNWEAVWAAAVHHDEGGWSVEMRIPLSQLRFDPSDEPQSWGINFARRRVQSNEVSYFALESRERYGGVSIFGRLEGLELPRAIRRIEVRPYTLGMTRGAPAVEANPFFDGSEHQGKVGADVRYGLGSTFVLDLTVNPDFGQVEVDPAVINLTAFETFFPERRPFFTRDDRIFDFELTGPRNNLFYSRRIGRSPQGSVPSADFTSVPGETRILGAAKVTGRTRDGFNIGALVALTPVERGRLFDRVTAETRDFEVEPQTIYGVLRASRELRGGDSHAGAIFTTTQRSLSSSARLLDELNSASYTGGVDFKHSWGDRGWQLAGIAAASTVRGSPQAILRTQSSSTHYFQRPDADPVRVDSTATSLTGGEWRLQIDRRTGRHWTWTAWAGQRAPGLEVNDIGYAPDGERIHGGGAAHLR